LREWWERRQEARLLRHVGVDSIDDLRYVPIEVAFTEDLSERDVQRLAVMWFQTHRDEPGPRLSGGQPCTYNPVDVWCAVRSQPSANDPRAPSGRAP
jgi:hypothetical protein